VRVTKTLTSEERVGTAVKVVVVTESASDLCRKDSARTCVKCLYVLTGDRFYLGVHIAYGCVTYYRFLLRVESAVGLLPSDRYGLHVLLPGRLWIKTPPPPKKKLKLPRDYLQTVHCPL
jgi:hypothetical protein